MSPVYEGKCEKCGKASEELLMFIGKELCWNCITQGRKPVESLTSRELYDLIRMTHPYEKGQPYSRMEIINELEKRGESVLKDLELPSDMDAMYRNKYTGDEETLYEILNAYGSPEERAALRKEGTWHNLFAVLEDWEPAVGPNVIRAKYLAEKKAGRGARALDEFMPERRPEKPREKIEVEIPAKPCPECGRPMTPQKRSSHLQVCEHCGKGWNVTYEPPQIYWEAKKPKVPEKPCEICNVNEATLNFPGFTYEWVCQSCHDQPSLWFPDKPAIAPKAQRTLGEISPETLGAWVKISEEKSPFPPFAKVQQWSQTGTSGELLEKLSSWMRKYPAYVIQSPFDKERWTIKAPDGATIDFAKYGKELQIIEWSDKEGAGYGGSTMPKARVEATIKAISQSIPTRAPPPKPQTETPKPARPPKQEFVVTTLGGNEVKVIYEPGFHNHFEFYGNSISETGYKSYFALEGEITGDPKEYAKTMADDLEMELLKVKPKRVAKILPPAKPPAVEKVEKPKALRVEELGLGDYVLYGGRVMVFGGVKDGTILLKDIFYPKGEYDLTFTKEKFEELKLPTKEYVTSEYERLEIKKPADFEMRLAKLPVATPEEEEEEEEEVEEAEVEEPAPQPPAKPPVVVQVKAEVSYPWSVELFTKKEVPEELRDMPIFSRSSERYEELEDFLKQGQTDEEDVVNEQLNTGVEAPDIAYNVHVLFGVDVPSEILKTSEKFRKGEEYTDEEYEKVGEWVGKLPSFIFKWDQADVKWTPEAENAKAIAGRKYRYDELIAFGKFTRKDIDFIARVKNLSTVGRMEDVARRIHSFDIGEEEVKSKLTDIEKLLG